MVKELVLSLGPIFVFVEQLDDVEGRGDAIQICRYVSQGFKLGHANLSQPYPAES